MISFIRSWESGLGKWLLCRPKAIDIASDSPIQIGIALLECRSFSKMTGALLNGSTNSALISASRIAPLL